MSEYLHPQQGQGTEDKTGLETSVTAYLTSVLYPSRGSAISTRNLRELTTLAHAIDALTKGEVAQAADH